jgi:hypothetical protein
LPDPHATVNNSKAIPGINKNLRIKTRCSWGCRILSRNLIIREGYILWDAPHTLDVTRIWRKSCGVRPIGIHRRVT